MLLPICGLGKHDPGPRLTDFVIPQYCRVFRCSSGPFVQFTLRLISDTTGINYCVQVILIFLRTTKTKLRQADYAV